MLRTLNGKKIETDINLQERVSGYNSVIIDIGTGDGRFVYKMARQQPDNFFIGVDPVAENMMAYGMKVIKKPVKGGLSNVLYVVASAEEMPVELNSIASKIFIILPWGSLLEGVAKGRREILENIARVAAPSAGLEIFFTYSDLHEQGEMSRRELPELSLEYIEETIVPLYRASGILITGKEIASNERLCKYETQWAKRLGFGKARTVFHIRGVVNK
ncbi:MAG: methyltransferase domain-containing protein [Desulfocucumaceae bacterium]